MRSIGRLPWIMDKIRKENEGIWRLHDSIDSQVSSLPRSAISFASVVFVISTWWRRIVLDTPWMSPFPASEDSSASQQISQTRTNNMWSLLKFVMRSSSKNTLQSIFALIASASFLMALLRQKRITGRGGRLHIESSHPEKFNVRFLQHLHYFEMAKLDRSRRSFLMSGAPLH
ncbi:hypothetical protein PROFUN_08629 [Planoprotostelium fungivorum]|uniref:Uncharacterized protein n=1 Tax=Planoprotostelium fungivorum TaxID=1890364 RepID=A0A2P6NJ11_9EUKA|nr:hypothetical protein PROFUN_08629 [Planoprotostelium fungivorum]